MLAAAELEGSSRLAYSDRPPGRGPLPELGLLDMAINPLGVQEKRKRGFE